jgi:hypothetical protein
MRVLMLLAGILATFAAGAQQQLRIGSGISHNTDSKNTYGWELGYAQALGKNAFITLGWLNQGHQENNYSDGLTTQIWARANLFEARMSLALGIGPYFFFDTTRDEPHPYYGPYENAHGLRPIYSAEITWFLNRSWLVYLRTNQINAEAKSNTTMLILGLGYQFDARSNSVAYPVPTVPSPAGETLNNELTLYLGRTSLNSFAPENSRGFALEYRRSLERYVDWTVGWLNEGDNQIIRRSGITSQFWLVRPLLDDRVALGIGAGAYIAVNEQNQIPDSDSSGERVSIIITLMASYRFDSHWFTRVSFNRVVTRYDRDSDVLLLGGGYRF